jgi:alpha-tubulin suppressor-like RCC1 family protein
VSVGAEHSAAVARHGSCYAWGSNSNGQLGLGDKEDRYVPTYVESFESTILVSVSCGHTHTAFTSHSGTLFCVGANDYGQCGIDDAPTDILTPRAVGAALKVCSWRSHPNRGPLHDCVAGTASEAGSMW